MKKIRLSILIAAMLMMVSTSAFALFKIEGQYTGYPKESGLGFGVNLPMIPFIDTTFYFTGLSAVKIDVPAFTIDGKSFGGNVKFSTLAAELQFKLPISVPVYNIGVGATTLFDIAYAVDTAGDPIMLPGSMYAGVFADQRNSIMPFMDYYIQLGYLFKVIDGEAAINDEIDPIEVDLDDIDKSGLFYRIGLSVGI